MAAYIGNQPVPQATQTRDTFTATAGQTSFPTSGYTAGFVDVYLNGVHLTPTDYTATNGSDIVLNSGAAVGDVLEVVAFSSFDVARLRNMTLPLGLLPVTTTERNALLNIGAGDTVFNTTTGSIEFYDGTTWIATNLIPTVNSVDGTIYSGAASTLTLNLTNATDTVDVKYYEGGTLLATDAGVTVTSGSCTVSVPAAVYGQSAGDTISVTIFNQDGTPSSNLISKTVLASPSGGSISTTGDYRVHQFTSSSNFVVPSGVTLTDVEYLVIGGGGAAGYNGGGGDNSAGGGAGGYRCSVPGELSGRNSSAETPLILSAGTYSVTIGAGGEGTATTGPDPAHQGSDSSFAGIISIGGGGENSSGGSGGGRRGTSTTSGSIDGTSGQGFDGGGKVNGGGGNGIFGGGGGGAGESGNTDGTAMGGDGLASSITGSTIFRAGGGAGGYDLSARAGGAGGGGNNNGTNGSGNGGNGQVNTGSGGGGCRYASNGATGANGGNGGSGIVIIRYQL